MNRELTYNKWIKYIHDYQLNKNKKMTKVKIIQRSVYHKIAEVEIEIPNDWNIHTEDGINFIHDYLIDNEDLYVDKIDEKISKAEYEFGFGLGDGMDEKDSEHEMRFDIVGEQYGGHL